MYQYDKSKKLKKTEGSDIEEQSTAEVIEVNPLQTAGTAAIPSIPEAVNTAMVPVVEALSPAHALNARTANTAKSSPRSESTSADRSQSGPIEEQEPVRKSGLTHNERQRQEAESRYRVALDNITRHKMIPKAAAKAAGAGYPRFLRSLIFKSFKNSDDGKKAIEESIAMRKAKSKENSAKEDSVVKAIEYLKEGKSLAKACKLVPIGLKTFKESKQYKEYLNQRTDTRSYNEKLKDSAQQRFIETIRLIKEEKMTVEQAAKAVGTNIVSFRASNVYRDFKNKEQGRNIIANNRLLQGLNTINKRPTITRKRERRQFDALEILKKGNAKSIKLACKMAGTNHTIFAKWTPYLEWKNQQPFQRNHQEKLKNEGAIRAAIAVELIRKGIPINKAKKQAEVGQKAFYASESYKRLKDENVAEQQDTSVARNISPVASVSKRRRLAVVNYVESDSETDLSLDESASESVLTARQPEVTRPGIGTARKSIRPGHFRRTSGKLPGAAAASLPASGFERRSISPEVIIKSEPLWQTRQYNTGEMDDDQDIKPLLPIRSADPVRNHLPILRDPLDPSQSLTLQAEGLESPEDLGSLHAYWQGIDKAASEAGISLTKKDKDRIKNEMINQVRNECSLSERMKKYMRTTGSARQLANGRIIDLGMGVFNPGPGMVPALTVLGPYAGIYEKPDIRKSGTKGTNTHSWDSLRGGTHINSLHDGNILRNMNAWAIKGYEPVAEGVNVAPVYLGKNIIFYVTIRPVQQGEEYFIDYGPNYEPDRTVSMARLEERLARLYLSMREEVEGLGITPGILAQYHQVSVDEIMRWLKEKGLNLDTTPDAATEPVNFLLAGTRNKLDETKYRQWGLSPEQIKWLNDHPIEEVNIKSEPVDPDEAKVQDPEVSGPSGAAYTGAEPLNTDEALGALRAVIASAKGNLTSTELVQWLQSQSLSGHSYHQALDILEDEEVEFEINDFIHAWQRSGRLLPET
ncbi:TPA: hypothetical protein QH957_004519 [Enterobacter bugandensis]|nr:hypothetical protein [Enterobacter bugandensis]